MNRWKRASQLLELARFSLSQTRGAKSSPTKLPVELLQDVAGLGPEGAIVKVKQGYARNFLIPSKLAAIRRGKQSGSVMGVDDKNSVFTGAQASLALMSEEEQQQHAILLEHKKLDTVIKKLTTTPLTLRRKASDDGNLEKPLSANDIADAVARQLQIEIVPELVDMEGEVLKTIGEYILPLKLLLLDGQKASMEVHVLSTS